MYNKNIHFYVCFLCECMENNNQLILLLWNKSNITNNEERINRMKKLTKIGFGCSILCFILVIPIIVIGFTEDSRQVYNIFGVLYLIAGTILFKITYQDMLVENRKSKRWCKPLTNQELEIIEDAKTLIKKVDKNIVISEFNVYKVTFLMKGLFLYDEDTHELNIFIPFKLLLRLGGKNLCFLVALHEILHSQNLKNNIWVFNKSFLEGVNQFFTIWLIQNYSEKYSIPKNKKFSLRLIKNLYIDVILYSFENASYVKEVKMVRDIFEKSTIDLKEAFINYINFNPNFFKNFVPTKFFRKQ